jgi:hypothetical protein
MTISVASDLRTFYAGHYVPRKLENPASRNVESYQRALTYWEALTDNPPLAAIDGNDGLLSDFKMQLAHACWRCTHAPCLCGKGAVLSLNSQGKQLDHIQWVIDEAGPRERRRPTAAGLIAVVPYTRKPKKRIKYRPAIRLESIAWVKHVADQASLPHGVTAPGDHWRALLEVMRCTSLRFGQCMALPWSAIDLGSRLMVLPDAICQKSKQDEPHPISSAAVGALLKIREDVPLVFGALALAMALAMAK